MLCAGWGEVECSCELRGVARSGEESQCEGAARRRDVGVRRRRTGERQRRFEFILRGRGQDCFAYVALLRDMKNTHEAARVEYGALASVENWIV